MIERYSLPEMTRLWSPEHKLNMWALVASVQAAALSDDPNKPALVEQLRRYAVPTVEAMQAKERVTRHDVAAFLHLWRDVMSNKHARMIHLGLTSSDLVDTATSATLAQVTDTILDAGDRLAADLARRALAWWDVERIGRTHGQPAEVTTLGFQFARHSLAMVGNLHRLTQCMEDVTLVKMSGPVGTYRFSSVEQERKAAELIGDDFKAAEIASQRLPREAYARWASELAILATSVEDFALQVRLGQQFGVEELFEEFEPGQVGSSAMPHKHNPIRSENLCGLARLVRAQVVPVMEGIPTWGDRDISHSSVERVALPTASTLTHFMLVGARSMLNGLSIDEDRMRKNIDAAGWAPNSSAYKVAVVRSGIAHPNEADRVVRKALGLNEIGPMLTAAGVGPIPSWAPSMRVDHVHKLMEEIADGA